MKVHHFNCLTVPYEQVNKKIIVIYNNIYCNPTVLGIRIEKLEAKTVMLCHHSFQSNKQEAHRLKNAHT